MRRFRDNVYAGETWTATAMSAGSLTSSNIGQTLFGSSIGLAGYKEVAYLVYQMFTTNPNAATQAAYSEAIWALTGSGVAVSALKAQGGLAWALYLAVTSGTEKLTQSQLAGLWIYTPTVPGRRKSPGDVGYGASTRRRSGARLPFPGRDVVLRSSAS